MAEDAFVTDFEHIMADDITDDVRFIMYDSESGKTASAGEVSKYMMKNIHVDTTLTEEGSAAEAKAVGDAFATKANTKGRYEDIVAGGAEQLMADGHESDSEPYLFRPTGGSADVGNREYVDKIVGGTVAWNQLYKRINVGTYNGLVVTLKSDGHTAVLNGTTTSVAYPVISDAGISTEYTTKVGHVYLLYKSTTTDGLMVYNDNAGVSLGAVNNYSVSKATGANKFYCRVDKGKTFSNLEVDFRIHDLTAMFGTTIADYIYSLEQSQAGAGVAWFRQYFPKDYYPYDAGSLQSVKATAHVETGKNLLKHIYPSETKNGVTFTENTDGTVKVNGTATANVEHSLTYRIAGTYGTCFLKAGTYIISGCPSGGGSSKYEIGINTTIGSSGVTLARDYGSGATFTIDNDGLVGTWITVRNGTTANNIMFKPMIRLASVEDATYEPYAEPTTYPLDSSLTLRGVPKLVDGKLSFDGDVYPPSGEVQRRYGIVDLGTLNWVYDSTVPMFYSSFSMAKASESDNSIGNIFCPKYQTTYRNNLQHSDVNKAISINSRKYISVKDTAYTDATAFKTAMSGVYLVYELATPTTETADGYEHYQRCDPSGTEEFVTTGIVPVGHETRYPHDLKKKIEAAPDSPSTDGTYLMKRSGGKNAYMALPSTPSANGAYVLTMTVSGGTASYSWTAKG